MYLQRLYCSATGETITDAGLVGLSPVGRPILCEYDLSAIRREVDRDAFAARPRGMWRWRELLPLAQPHEPITLGEGDTPLRRATRLGEALGLPRLWIKDESGNPTGSFKARGLSAAVTMAAHLGARALVIPSAGNAGGALAAYAARAGIPAHVFVPADTPVVAQREVLLYGAELYRVDGLIDDCGRIVAQRRDALGAFDLSTLKEPYRLEGKKTLGLEIAEALGWRLPDVIVYPTGGGTGLVGMHKAFDELATLGWIDPARRPRMVCVQAAGCAPIVSAFERGAQTAEPWVDAHTRAWGLRVPRAVGDALMLRALRESQGTAVAVEENTLHADARLMARCEGVDACPEGGACVTAVRQLLETGWLSRDEEIVIFNTGAGTKYVETLPELPSETIPAGR